MTTTLPFNVDPNLITELGINLYTDLPRVLAEFVANAWDADAEVASVNVDTAKLQALRQVVSVEYRKEMTQWKNVGSPADKKPVDLGLRTLPTDATITIKDDGVGMSREELKEKFLKVGRKRRSDAKVTEVKKRPLMGRKGIGKLSGFGVAQVITVVSRKAGDAKASRIVLDYRQIKNVETMQNVSVPYDEIDPPAGLTKGTIITLSHLGYEGTKSRGVTIQDRLIDSFAIFGAGYDMIIELNDVPLEYPKPNLQYSYPVVSTETQPTTDLITVTIKIVENDVGVVQGYEMPGESGNIPANAEDLGEVQIRYRIWFLDKHVDSENRGVRLYAHGRLVHPPSLYQLETGTHGHRYSSYLNGVVEANFIDDQEVDLVATDRQGLKWDFEPLAGLRHWLSTRLAMALNSVAKVREEKHKSEVRKNAFTKQLIDSSNLVGSQVSLAYALAQKIASATDGLGSPEYENVLTEVVKGIGNGDLMTRLTEISRSSKIDAQILMKALLELSGREYDDFTSLVRGRLQAIDALAKLYKEVDFKAGKNEKELQALLGANPWLIDPMYSKFITSDKPEGELFAQLAKELEIENYATAVDADRKKKRPDLTFLLGDPTFSVIVIVELKAPNLPLEREHLQQLEDYITDTEKFLVTKKKQNTKVLGFLIGSRDHGSSGAQGVKQLDAAVAKRIDGMQWQVWDLDELLERTRQVHRQFLEKAPKRPAADEAAG